MIDANNEWLTDLCLDENDNSGDDDPFAPVDYKKKITLKRLAVVDTETDPFAPGFLIKPFALGFRTSDRYVDFWGDNCCQQFFDYLATLDEEFIIYAHNGGKFDFFFFLKWLDEQKSPLIMNGRLVKLYFQGQEFRDSYSIIPRALRTYAKEDIDYDKFKRSCRQRHKAEILHYQEKDCDYLFDLVSAFHEQFGDRLTIASASLNTLHSYHGFERLGERADAKLRSYYSGGRNQCFETGLLKPSPGAEWLIVDRNSMYPAVMFDEQHPISANHELNDHINERTDFACIVAHNKGALPTRTGVGLDFTRSYGEFYASIHEIRAGLETDTLKIERVKHTWEFERHSNFVAFVDEWYNNKRTDAKQRYAATGDAKAKIEELFAKDILNSSYGKFALNPRKFKQYQFSINQIPEPQRSVKKPDGWALHSSSGPISIWQRPTPRKGGFYNVATAASITSAARANLLRNLALATRPIYCDTDSIICEAFSGDLHETRLGGWKVEATGNLAAIAGKKLYAVFNEGECIKKASKGCTLAPADIMAVCNGATIQYNEPVPTFKLDGTATFITRNIRATG